MSRAHHEARRADEARTRYSTRSLATGRKGSSPNPAQLRAEQDDYRSRYRSTHAPSVKQMPLIVDTDTGHTVAWDRTTSRTVPAPSAPEIPPSET
jgi:hypothetical protein